MNIVFLETDTLGNDISLDQFEQLGNVTYYRMSDPEENHIRVKDADIIVVNKIPMNEETLHLAEHLKLICLTATGSNNIDFDYTNKNGITVCNVSGYSTNSVVQHTFALLFFLYEKLDYYNTYVKSGKYCNSKLFSKFDQKFNELHGKTWGIIGLGEIGRGVATVASQFGCHVIYYSTSGKNKNSLYPSVSLDELLKTSDMISIHAPLNDDTYHLIGQEELEKMKSSSIILNLGRGNIIDEEALTVALENNQIAGAGLDVLSAEPILPDNPLLRIQDSTKLLITPHIAWATVEARKRCVGEVYKNIQAFLKGEKRNVLE